MADKKVILFPEQIVHNKLPCNIAEHDFYLFKKAIDEKLPASYYWQLDNALILKDTVFRNFKFWQEYSHLYNLGIKSKVKRLLLNFFKKRKIEKGVWITDSWSSGYFHWFSDALPRLVAVKHYLSDHIVLLPENFKSIEYITQSLELIDQPYVFLNDKIPARVKEFILTSHLTPTGNFNPEIIRSLRKKYLFNKEFIKPYRKIFISRQGAKTRRLLNESELISVLKENNFEIHFFEEYSFKQQIKLMSECLVLAGLHGGGLTNMMFMQSGGTVIELRKEDDNHNNCYFSMASGLDLNYYYFKCSANNSSTQLADFEIKVDELNNLKILLSEQLGF